MDPFALSLLLEERALLALRLQHLSLIMQAALDPESPPRDDEAPEMVLPHLIDLLEDALVQQRRARGALERLRAQGELRQAAEARVQSLEQRLINVRDHRDFYRHKMRQAHETSARRQALLGRVLPFLVPDQLPGLVGAICAELEGADILTCMRCGARVPQASVAAGHPCPNMPATASAGDEQLGKLMRLRWYSTDWEGGLAPGAHLAIYIPSCTSDEAEEGMAHLGQTIAIRKVAATADTDPDTDAGAEEAGRRAPIPCDGCFNEAVCRTVEEHDEAVSYHCDDCCPHEHEYCLKLANDRPDDGDDDTWEGVTWEGVSDLGEE